jgi:hypothetical protein
VTNPQVIAGRRRLPKEALDVEVAVAKLRRCVRDQLRFGGVEHSDALALDLRKKPRLFMPDDLGNAHHLDRLTTSASAIHAFNDPFCIPDEHPRSGGDGASSHDENASWWKSAKCANQASMRSHRHARKQTVIRLMPSHLIEAGNRRTRIPTAEAVRRRAELCACGRVGGRRPSGRLSLAGRYLMPHLVHRKRMPNPFRVPIRCATVRARWAHVARWRGGTAGHTTARRAGFLLERCAS